MDNWHRCTQLKLYVLILPWNDFNVEIDLRYNVEQRSETATCTIFWVFETASRTSHFLMIYLSFNSINLSTVLKQFFDYSGPCKAAFKSLEWWFCALIWFWLWIKIYGHQNSPLSSSFSLINKNNKLQWLKYRKNRYEVSMQTRADLEIIQNRQLIF